MINLKGVVRLETIDGKLIFEKENMIVDNGRKYLLNLMHSKLTSSTTTEDRRIATLRFGVGSNMTENNSNTLNSVISSLDTTINATNTTILGGSEPIGVKIIVEKTGTEAVNPQMISELGLFLSGSPTQMFSRIIFEPVPFTISTTYRLTYYIYF
jgi:hypothetical protein